MSAIPCASVSLKTMFCKKCNSDTERDAGGCCKPCVKARKAAYRIANREKLRIRNAAWVAGNPEKAKEYRARWLEKNPDKDRIRSAAYRAATPEKHRLAVATWRAENPDKAKANNAAWRAANPGMAKQATINWRKANPEAVRSACRNYRARKIDSGGVLSKELAAKLFGLQRGMCPCCRMPLGDDFHMDHIIPLALGGANTDENMQLLRSTCNLKKNKKHPVEYMQSKGFLL